MTTPSPPAVPAHARHRPRSNPRHACDLARHGVSQPARTQMIKSMCRTRGRSSTPSRLGDEGPRNAGHAGAERRLCAARLRVPASGARANGRVGRPTRFIRSSDTPHAAASPALPLEPGDRNSQQASGFSASLTTLLLDAAKLAPGISTCRPPRRRADGIAFCAQTRLVLGVDLPQLLSDQGLGSTTRGIATILPRSPTEPNRLMSVRSNLDAVVDVSRSSTLLPSSMAAAAGRRDVAIPDAIVLDLRAHLERWSEPGADGRVFVGPKGAIPRRTNFQATWRTAVEKAGVTGLHFHDLRHTGNALAAQEASLRELMARMGHSSTRAALIYQHASRDREQAIGSAISALIEASRTTSKGHAGGTNPESGPESPLSSRRRKSP
jgi:Phage integrase family